MANPEASLIAAVCENKDIATVVTSSMDHMFVTHKDIWNGLKQYYQKYKDVPTVDLLQSKFKNFEAPKVSSPTQFYVDQLKESYVATQVEQILINGSRRLKGESAMRALDEMQKSIAALSRETSVVKDVNITDVEDAESHYTQLRLMREENGGSLGIKTGLKAFDVAVPAGLAPGNLIILLGYSARGKTWLSGYLAVKAFEQGKRPMIISMEMTADAMRDRIYATMANGTFRVSDFQTGSIDFDDFRSWGRKSVSNKQDFIIVASDGMASVNTNTIQSKIDQHKPDMLVVDYIQLMSDIHGGKSETERVKNISQELKRLAMRNNIPVVAISAVTAPDLSVPDSPPMLEQVSWSRSIQFDADLAVAVHLHDNTSIVECVSRKNRFGPHFAVFLDSDFSCGRIEERFDIDLESLSQ